MTDYRLENDKFIIRDYDLKKTFSSFLPGIAGTSGVPFWCFYVNRGQGVSGFGIKDKSCPIMEFSPASIAYSRVNYNGFRTFVLKDDQYFEPFGVLAERSEVTRTMEIERSGFSLTEQNKKDNVETRVEYFGLAEEAFPALMRVLTLKNVGDGPIELTVCDGLAELLPYGLSNADYKSVGNLFRSWMLVENKSGVQSFRMRSSTSDSAEVRENGGGHFYISDGGQDSVRVVNPSAVFGYDSSKSLAHAFIQKRGVLNGTRQDFENELPCAFTVFKARLNAGESVKLHTMTGTYDDVEVLARAGKLCCEKSFEDKKKKMDCITENIADGFGCRTADKTFDAYIRQCFFDNVLRGGLPVKLDNKKEGVCYYLYSRKHGDLERDYNWFNIEPGYYSSGNGNFRDVLQNRRNDIFFLPEAGEENLVQFVSLLGADGGNPLSVNGIKFTYRGENAEAKKLFSKPFTYGQIFKAFKEGKIEDPADILCNSESSVEAEFTEGYWCDHFVYLNDLIENYLAVYPDRAQKILYNTPVGYFESPAQILPRSEKIVYAQAGIRRYGAIDERATKRRAKVMGGGTFMETDGKRYLTNLASKLTHLVCVKIATLDFDGLGLDMEADKPGWNDALNGLPALFGSSVADLLELKRLALTLYRLLTQWSGELKLSNEQIELLRDIKKIFPRGGIDYFKAANELKEEFRRKLYRSKLSQALTLSSSEAAEFLKACADKIENNLRGFEAGLMPTYLCYEPTGRPATTEEGTPLMTHYGLPAAIVESYTRHELPAFLEGEAKYLYSQPVRAAEHYRLVKQSGLYDRELNVFKTSVCLNSESQEIGRIRSFVKGWLERESCFLHMDYKYLLGLLKSGLYEEFYSESETNWVCNMPPERYGRSILENSTFIVTGNHCDSDKVGQGFQPRLTGANPEMLSMLMIMFTGGKPFEYRRDRLCFSINPKLHKKFFDGNGEAQIKLFNSVQIKIINKTDKSAYEPGIKVLLSAVIGGKKKFFGQEITGRDAELIREGGVELIEAVLENS